MTDVRVNTSVSTAERLRRGSARAQSPGRRTLRRFLSHWLAVFGTALLLLMGFCALFAPIVAPANPSKIDLTNISKPPSAEHWLGTDAVGRDVLSRLIYGARVSLSVGLVAVTLYMTIGFVLGAVSGFFGGWVDTAIMRFTDIMLCFPTFVLILILVGLLGPNIGNVMLVIGLFGWPGVARLVRGQVLQLRELDYVIAARMLGARRWYVLWKHLLPNVIGPLTVAATLGIASAILTEAGLSFLGLGVVQPTPSWGAMLNEARPARRSAWPYWRPTSSATACATPSTSRAGPSGETSAEC